jgi:hypothetical protein
MRARALALSMLLPLAGCGSGQIVFGDIEDAEDVVQACEDMADQVVTEQFRIEFDGTTGGCPWGEDGNLWPTQGVLTARVEQQRSLELEDALICDMEFTFAGEAGLEQDIEYDDNFLFVFNDVVLASSYRPWVEQLEADGIYRLYDWDQIVGQENLFDESIPTYCVGDDSDLASCDIPPPETNGPISLSFDLSITSELSYRASEEDRRDFTFIATGDNDESIDCSHGAFYFDVDVPYLPM